MVSCNFDRKRLHASHSHLSSSDRPTLPELISQLDEVVDWFHLGLYLSIPQHELLIMEDFRRGHKKQCRTDMLSWWLQHGTQLTWTALVRAVDGIKMEPLARKIATKYGRFIIQAVMM